MSIAGARLKKEDVVKVYSGIAPLYDLWSTLTETRARRKAQRPRPALNIPWLVVGVAS